jgi:hypothetical protein
VAALGVRAAIVHDAGIGLRDAGVAALPLLEVLGTAAAAVGHTTARVGDADDMLLRGRVSRVNGPAKAVGLVEGMPVSEAIAVLGTAPMGRTAQFRAQQSRSLLTKPRSERVLVLADSASLVNKETDTNAIVVTGSHGGLVGGDSAMALQVDAFAAVFNDAGVGIDSAGIARLDPLDARGIAAAAVHAASARIGEAASTLGGIISAVNGTASALGARVGDPIGQHVLAWMDLPRVRRRSDPS